MLHGANVKRTLGKKHWPVNVLSMKNKNHSVARPAQFCPSTRAQHQAATHTTRTCFEQDFYQAKTRVRSLWRVYWSVKN